MLTSFAFFVSDHLKVAGNVFLSLLYKNITSYTFDIHRVTPVIEMKAGHCHWTFPTKFLLCPTF